ncbi:MAG: hypothetical protein A2V93_04680 [Ignavibacteria bacterium RBG_16_34_14]|nr:MAG: hypothetical protein A2V93_04680 [Ignavibacteria bacterium RBG_16_34_14]
MKRKNYRTEIDNFRSSGSILIWHNKKNYASEKKLTETLTNIFNHEEIKKLKKDFDKFFKIIENNAIDDEAKQLLKKSKKGLKNNFLMRMYIEIISSPYQNMKNAADESITENLLSDAKLREIIISQAEDNLFYYADIVMAFVMGNEEKLALMKERVTEMSGKKLRPERKVILERIVNTRNQLKKNKSSSHNFSWKIAIKNTYKGLTEQQKRELLILNLNPVVQIPIELTDKQIKSITESIRHNNLA